MGFQDLGEKHCKIPAGAFLPLQRGSWRKGISFFSSLVFDVLMQPAVHGDDRFDGRARRRGSEGCRQCTRLESFSPKRRQDSRFVRTVFKRQFQGVGVQKKFERIPRLNRGIEFQLEFQDIQWIRIETGGRQVVEQVVSVLDVCRRVGRKGDPLDVDEQLMAGEESDAMGRKTCASRA